MFLGYKKLRNNVVLISVCAFTCAIAISMADMSCTQKQDNVKVAVVNKYYQCPMHPQIIMDKPGKCPICAMDLVPVDKGYSASHDSAAGLVHIDPSVVQNMGVAVETVTVRLLKKEIRTSAIIDLDETGVAIVNTKISGWVEKLYADYTGQKITKGEPLLTLYSPDLVSTQEEYIQALRYAKSLSVNVDSVARKGAQDVVESARKRLANWDIPDRDIQELEQGGAAKKTMTISAPQSGVVLEKMVVAGQNISAGMALYKIADLSTVWAMASVYQEDLPYVKIGAGADITISALPNKTFYGTVQFISPVLDAVTKTVGVRIALRNMPDLSIRPQMFANAILQSPVSLKAITVSAQAVLHTGRRDVVIVSMGNGNFRAQDVTIGMTAGGFVQIATGLHEGDIVVASSQFMIDAESDLREAVKKMSGESTGK